MTTRRITPHKGGRTARIPSGWILPETLRRIHEAKREQGVSFADLIEEKFSGGNTMYSVFVTIDPNTGYEVYSVDYSDTARINEIASGFDTRDAAWEWVRNNT